MHQHARGIKVRPRPAPCCPSRRLISTSTLPPSPTSSCGGCLLSGGVDCERIPGVQHVSCAEGLCQIRKIGLPSPLTGCLLTLALSRHLPYRICSGAWRMYQVVENRCLEWRIQKWFSSFRCDRLCRALGPSYPACVFVSHSHRSKQSCLRRKTTSRKTKG